MALTLSLSPSFSLARDGAPVALKNRKAQALLVYLALTGKPQSREHLATLLWGDRFDEQARNSLRQALFALRKAVGEGVVVGDDPLELAAGAVTVVADGELLRGFATGAESFDGWLEAERASRGERAVAKLMHEGEEMLARLDDQAALDRFERALVLSPLNEAALRQSMVILGRLDRRADALARFERFRAALKDELDAAPAAETQALAEVLRQGPEPAQDATDHPNALVVPFEDLGGGELATFVARGMQEEMSLHIRSMGFVVVDLSSEKATEMGSGEALMGLARKMGAQAMVTGTARQIGEKVRVTIRIVSVAEGTTVWSHRTIIDSDTAFERMGELGTIAVGHFTQFSSGQKNADELIAMLRRETDRPEAFLATWTNFLWRSYAVHHTRAHLKNVVEMSAFAYEHFPKNPAVAASRANALFHAAHLSDGKDRADRYADADAILQRALAIDRSNVTVLMTQMIVSSWMGRFGEVDDAFARIRELGADWPATAGLYMQSLVFRERNDEVFEIAREVVKSETGSPLMFYRFAYMGLAHFNKGDFAMALRCATDALEVGREFFLGHIVKIAALGRLGRHADAVEALEDMRLDYRDPTVSEFDFLPFTNEVRKQALLDALRDAGMPD